MCTEVINDRDAALRIEADEASAAVVTRIVETDEAAPAELEAWKSALDKFADSHRGGRAQLAELRPVSSDVAVSWSVVVESGDETIDLLDRRSGLLDSGEWATVRDGWPRAVSSDNAEFVDAVEDLELQQTDCAVVYTAVGVPAKHRVFVARAATTCAAVRSRRDALGHAGHATVVLETLADVMAGRTVDVSDEAMVAIQASADEWRRTSDDLRAVPVDDVLTPPPGRVCSTTLLDGWTSSIGAWRR